MKPKDELKRKSIIDKTIHMVYQHGFAGIKMAELARMVGISPSTLYVYFKSKEDLILSISTSIIDRETLASANEISDDLPFKIKLRKLWLYWLNFSLNHRKEMSFISQLKQSPYLSRMPKDVLDAKHKISNDLFDLGKREGLIKDLPNEMLGGITGALLGETVHLVDQRVLDMNDKGINTAFNLLWDAIKN